MPLAERKSFGKVAKEGVAWSFLRQGVTEVLLFPASMVMARLLTPAEFGISTAAIFFIQLSSRLSDLGFNAALVRAKTVTSHHLSSVFIVNSVVGILTFGALVAVAPLVGSFYGIPETGQIMPIAALSFLIAPAGSVPGALLAREGRFRELSIVDWYYCLTYAVLGTLLAWLGFSFWSLVYSQVAAVAVQALSRFYFMPWRPSLVFSTRALRDVLSFGIGMHSKRLLEYTAGNVDNLIVGRLMGMTALGLYDKAFSTMRRFLGRMNTGGPNVMFRIFALIHEDPERFRRAYSKVIMSTSLVGFPVFAVLIATAPQLIEVMFGAPWLPAAEPFQLLCAVGALKLLNSYASAATQAAGRIWSEVLLQLIYVLLIVGSLIVLRDLGPTGAAAGVLMATAAMTMMMHVLLKRVTHLPWSAILQPLTPALLCAAGAGAIVKLVENALGTAVDAPATWLLLLSQACAAAAFVAAFVLLAPLADVRALVHEMATDLAPATLMRQRWVQWCLRTRI